MTDYRFDLRAVAWALSLDDLRQMLGQIETATDIVLDLETTGLDEYATTSGKRNGGVAARVVLLTATLPQPGDGPHGPTTWIVPLSHPDSPFMGHWRRILRLIANSVLTAEGGFIGQNIKFDCRWIYATTGVDLSRRITWDTRISSHLLDENHSTSLKSRAARTFGIRRWDDFSLAEPGAAERVPLVELGEYGARDTYWTWALAEVHRARMMLGPHAEGAEPQTPEEVEDARLGRLALWCAIPTVATLTAIEQRGIQLDRDWVRGALRNHRASAAALTEDLAGRYGIRGEPSFAPTSHWFRDWAQAAVKAGDLRVTALTPTGKPQWSKEVLVRQSRKGSTVAADLLALRQHLKKAEFLSSWLAEQDPDGAIRTNYSSGSVVTGRLSSSSPNMQQVTAALKPAFVPRPGFVFADLDYSQIELRVAAHVSGCQPMIEAFRRGDDLHRLLAARITGKGPGLVTKEERQAGKSANFGLLYGMGPYGFRIYAADVYGVDLSMDEAKAIHRAFFDTWEGMAEWHARVARRTAQTGRSVSPIGRVRRLPRIHDGNEETVAAAERAAINSPVQGLASDIMQIAAACIEGTLPGSEPISGAYIVATVHDSIVIEVPEDSWEDVTHACIQQMIHSAPLVLETLGCRLTVPLAVEGKIGTRWGLDDVGIV